MKRIIPCSLVLGLTVLSLSLNSCEIKRGKYVEGANRIFCDDGFKNILEEEIDVFEFTYPEASIIPKYVSEADAYDAMMNDSTDAIIVTHEMSKADQKTIRDKYKKVVKQRCIAVDAVALIVNKDNPIDHITMDELQQIITGKINTWDKLALADTTDIQLVFDNANSSTVMYMRDKFLNGKPISSIKNVKAFAENNNMEVFEKVKDDPSALGIISVSWLGDSLEYARKVPIQERIEGYEEKDELIAHNLTTEVKVLGIQNPTEENDSSLKAYKPYQAYIATGEYPLFRKVYMITTASNSTLMKSFYDFVTGFVGQKIIAGTGILPYFMNPRVVELRQP